MDDIAAVLFDLDHTLCLPAQDGEALLARSFDRAGVDPLFAPADVDAVDTATLPTAESTREFFGFLFDAAAERADGDPDDADVAAVADAYVDLYDPADVSVRPGAREALSVARERYDVGLVTNGGRETQIAKLDAVGMADAFAAEVYCDPGAGIEPKPDPTPVTMAIEELGVDPDEAVLVGDDLGVDVAGAHNAGAHSAWVPLDDPRPDPEPAPRHVLDGMDAFATLLEG